MMLAEGTAVLSRAKRLYSSSMYSGGSLPPARCLAWGLGSVRFIVDRKWLRRSWASSSGLSPAALPTDAPPRFSGGLTGLLRLRPVHVRSRTFRGHRSPRLEGTEAVMVMEETIQRPTGKTTWNPREWTPAERLLLGDNEERSFAPWLILWFWSEGRAVLSNVLL